MSKDGGREEKRNGRGARIKNHRPRETLIPPLLSHFTDIISLFIYPLLDRCSFKEGKLNGHGARDEKLRDLIKRLLLFEEIIAEDSRPSPPVIIIFPSSFFLPPQFRSYASSNLFPIFRSTYRFNRGSKSFSIGRN